jgi:hypothetical protein
MFLCALEGVYKSNDFVCKKIVLTQYNKHRLNPRCLECEVCAPCFGLINIKYKLTDDDKYLVPYGEKIKIYEVKSRYFENRNADLIDEKKDLDNPKKLITQLMKKMRNEEK